MNVKDIKTFLDRFDDAEEIADIEFETCMDICVGCNDYNYDEYYEDCRNIQECLCKEHKNIARLNLAFVSDISEDGYIYGDNYRTLEVKTQR